MRLSAAVTAGLRGGTRPAAPPAACLPRRPPPLHRSAAAQSSDPWAAAGKEREPLRAGAWAAREERPRAAGYAGGPPGGQHAARRGPWPAPRASGPRRGEGPAAPPEPEPITGGSVLRSGKHAGRSFEEILAREPQYCQWLAKTALEKPKDMQHFLPFIIYAQHQWLEQQKRRPEGAAPKPPLKAAATAPATAGRLQEQGGAGMGAPPHKERPATPTWPEVWGLEGCLGSKLFVLTGTSATVPRTEVERLILFFGGELRSAVSGKTDFLLVVGEQVEDHQHNSRPVETSAKYKTAQAKGVPILIGLDSLIKKIRPPSDHDVDEEKLLRFNFNKPEA